MEDVANQLTSKVEEYAQELWNSLAQTNSRIEVFYNPGSHKKLVKNIWPIIEANRGLEFPGQLTSAHIKGLLLDGLSEFDLDKMIQHFINEILRMLPDTTDCNLDLEENVKKELEKTKTILIKLLPQNQWNSVLESPDLRTQFSTALANIIADYNVQQLLEFKDQSTGRIKLSTHEIIAIIVRSNSTVENYALCSKASTHIRTYYQVTLENLELKGRVEINSLVENIKKSFIETRSK